MYVCIDHRSLSLSNTHESADWNTLYAICQQYPCVIGAQKKTVKGVYLELVLVRPGVLCSKSRVKIIMTYVGGSTLHWCFILNIVLPTTVNPIRIQWPWNTKSAKRIQQVALPSTERPKHSAPLQHSTVPPAVKSARAENAAIVWHNADYIIQQSDPSVVEMGGAVEWK